jgi:hypothetical protein
VFIDGEKALTLRGEHIASEFHALVERYIEQRYGAAARQPLTPSRPEACMPRRRAPGRGPVPTCPSRPTLFCKHLMAEPLKAVKGMNDILPPESARWEWLEDTSAR